MIIGVTGWFASGKDTVADYLKEKGLQSISLSDILREKLREEGIEVIRENLLKKGNELREKHGTGHLAELALARIKKVGGKNWIIPSVRQVGEIEELRKSNEFVLWEIYAPIEIRFDRMRKRDKNGEDDAIDTIEEFKKREQLETSGKKNAPQLDLVIPMADIIVDNSGTFEKLYTKIDKLISEVK
ncbi:hypothetical protein COT78_01945 [Candidatus Berkelbacteria bacterium CG10_big_fil_rev_8_21_14_0_10_43_13]|uniref:Dephospho-CoA kinase n=1 Tax=Candidatus Berkelbacteria bacterium CG10_big_fil_rev_8_21_14_0_10_43_13 TaxID=1974514 RepID=A0A2H0W6I3_9BACT|nr:MAG: hypothetical protein COT78_01945 [Candidatus Berkelbacteria bacterium CG10_big_fil_rev_8_21_14_0_10_43_13]